MSEKAGKESQYSFAPLSLLPREGGGWKFDIFSSFFISIVHPFPPHNFLLSFSLPK